MRPWMLTVYDWVDGSTRNVFTYDHPVVWLAKERGAGRRSTTIMFAIRSEDLTEEQQGWLGL